MIFARFLLLYPYEERNYKIAKIKLEEENEQIRLSLIRDAYDEAEKFFNASLKSSMV